MTDQQEFDAGFDSRIKELCEIEFRDPVKLYLVEAPAAAKMDFVVGPVQVLGWTAPPIHSLRRSDLKRFPRWSRTTYFAPFTKAANGESIELVKIYDNKFTIITSGGRYTHVHNSVQDALLEADTLFGLCLPDKYDPARIFAVHETEANWPRGWYFSE